MTSTQEVQRSSKAVHTDEVTTGRMDWEDDHLTQKVRPTTRTGSVSEAMGSPMGAHDPRLSTVASVAGEEECRGVKDAGHGVSSAPAATQYP